MEAEKLGLIGEVANDLDLCGTQVQVYGSKPPQILVKRGDQYHKIKPKFLLDKLFTIIGKLETDLRHARMARDYLVTVIDEELVSREKGDSNG